MREEQQEPPDRARGQGAALDDGLDRHGVLTWTTAPERELPAAAGAGPEPAGRAAPAPQRRLSAPSRPPPGQQQPPPPATWHQPPAAGAAARLPPPRLPAATRSRTPTATASPPFPDNGPAVAGFVLSLVVGRAAAALAPASRRIVSIGCAVAGIDLLAQGQAEGRRRARRPKHARPRPGRLRSSGSSALVLSVLATLGWILVLVAGGHRRRVPTTTSSTSSTTPRASRGAQAAAPRRCACSAEALDILAAPMANPYLKQYLMTAGPDAAAAARCRR